MEQRVLGGRYLLKDRVGTGGMATVYRAQDQVLDRTVAVKIMLPQYAGDATFAARFKQEAQAAAGLSSPYIVGVYDWGKDGDTYYIVMEYLRGTDLKSGVKSHGALDPKKVAQIGSQISSALSVAHKHEIIHRDIKPQNIMVLPDGNIKVMDFGIARAKNSHLTQDNNVLGTAHYVSPEQTRGQELGPTSDIYSLGVVMYECATGRVPFDGDDAISVALKQVNEYAVPPSQVNPGVDADLERIILKCMEKDPAARFQSADELRQVLNNYISGRAVDVPEPTRVIAGAAGAGQASETRAMVRPVNSIGNTQRSAAADSDKSYGESDKKKGGKGKIAAAVIAALVIIGIAVAFATGVFGGSTVTVPDVLGKNQQSAISALEDAGLEIGTVTQSYNDDYDSGEVCEQNPDAGTEKPSGTKVNIVISKGAKPAEKVEVPALVGKTKAEAEAALAAVGLKGSATEENNDADEGKVFEQGTEAGKEVEKGSTVEYKVSKGPDTATVPGVVGQSKTDATNTLSNAGFKVAYAEDTSDSVSEGYVISQDVTGTATTGSTVTITICTGPKTQSSTVPSVQGMTVTKAFSTLEAQGFKRGQVVDANGNAVSESSYATAVVTGISPSGTQKQGTAISLTVRLADTSSSSSNSSSSSSTSGTSNSTGTTTTQ